MTSLNCYGLGIKTEIIHVNMVLFLCYDGIFLHYFSFLELKEISIRNLQKFYYKLSNLVHFGFLFAIFFKENFMKLMLSARQSKAAKKDFFLYRMSEWSYGLSSTKTNFESYFFYRN